MCQKNVFAKLSGCQKMRFSKRKLFFFVFVFFMLLQEKQTKEEKEIMPKNAYKNSVFKVVIPKCEK